MSPQACALFILLLFTACGTHTDAAVEQDAAYGPLPSKAAEPPDGAAAVDPPSSRWIQPERREVRFVPNVDANAALMGRLDVLAVQKATFTRPLYWTEAVPRVVHRVLRPGEQEGFWPEYAAWQAYCATMGYELRQWDPARAAAASQQASTPRAKAFVAAHEAGRPDIAAQLTALAVLAKHGGFLIGPDVMPPSRLNCALDLQDMGNRQGLTLATNLRARRVGGWSVYVTTALMVAPPQHPWVVAASAGAADNTVALLQSEHAELPGRYFAGNAYLSRNLAGIFSILPFTYLQDLGMFPTGQDPMSEEDALE